MDRNLEYSLYTYSLTNLERSVRVKFVYALKGRGDEAGLVSHYKGRFLAPACFIVPIKNDNHIRDVFNQWKIRFKRHHIKMIDDKN